MVVVRGTRQVSEIIVLSIEMVAVVVLEIRAKQEKLHVPWAHGTLVHTRPRSYCLSNKLQHVSRGQPTGRRAAPRLGFPSA